VNRTRIGILNGTVKEKHILTVIGPDESGIRFRIEPPHGTVWHVPYLPAVTFPDADVFA
jgi:hypothetical protein